MPTFNNGESAASVRTKINEAIDKVDGASPITSADINGGTIDGTTIGGSSAAAATFTDVGADALDLSAIAATKAVTAVDVFVYDTSKDSDGGAWRKRTQNTSWYQETLNTATRGARRKFPAVAVIVAEAAKVTIYDGDDPALPMWHVEDYTGLTIRAAVAINGQIWIGTSTGVIASDYAGDDLGTTTLDYTTSTTPAIVNNSVNDVAATVLPDAPIDPATGLPVPTIRVGTAGGISVINDDGTVTSTVSSTYTQSTSDDPDYDLWQRYLFGRSLLVGGSIYAYMSSSWYLGLRDRFGNYLDQWAGGDVSEGAPVSLKLTQIAFDPTGAKQHMSCGMTATYCSGWMPALIRGAFLSDTDDTDLVASGELVTNGDFSGGTTGWTLTGSADVVSGELVFVGGAAGDATFSVGSQPAGVYRLKIDKTVLGAVGSANTLIRLRSGTANVASVSIGGANGPLSYDINVVATGAFDNVYVFYNGTGAYEYKFDNISVILADADRSVNNNGLIVNGTVTRTAVATNADLVGYSGFSANNYLEQPYNADLDFGTDEFAIMGWLKQAANTAVETILERDSAVSAQRFTLAVNASGFLTFTCDDDTTARTATSNRVVDNDVWTHFVALYDGAGDVKIYLNGVLDDTETGSALLTLNNASAVLRVGLAVDDAEPLDNADLALLRISATVPSDSQIKKIYEDEKFLFQDNAQATLYGASDAVTALAHDPVTDLLHVGTSAGRSVFQGLRRVSNTTTAVGTAISASNGLVVEE
jgi:trimeric autotransporter adhesin